MNFTVETAISKLPDDDVKNNSTTNTKQIEDNITNFSNRHHDSAVQVFNGYTKSTDIPPKSTDITTRITDNTVQFSDDSEYSVNNSKLNSLSPRLSNKNNEEENISLLPSKKIKIRNYHSPEASSKFIQQKKHIFEIKNKYK